MNAALRVSTAVAVTTATGVAALFPTPAANAQRFVGTDREDRIVGTAQADEIFLRRGDDAVTAGEGADTVFGGHGGDIIRLGSPEIASGEAIESAHGGPGTDNIFGTGSRDRIDGGPGSDLIFGMKGADEITDGEGPDDVSGLSGRDLIRLKGGGRDLAYGGPHRDLFIVFPDGLPDRISCGSGRDTVKFRFRREAVDKTTGCERQRVGSTGRQLVPHRVESGI